MDVMAEVEDNNTIATLEVGPFAPNQPGLSAFRVEIGEDAVLT